MRTYTVNAAHRESQWRLDIDREGTTSVSTLDDAERQVRYFLTLLHEEDYDDARIVISIPGQRA